MEPFVTCAIWLRVQRGNRSRYYWQQAQLLHIHMMVYWVGCLISNEWGEVEAQ